jgi:hypothetical protein
MEQCPFRGKNGSYEIGEKSVYYDYFHLMEKKLKQINWILAFSNGWQAIFHSFLLGQPIENKSI